MFNCSCCSILKCYVQQAERNCQHFDNFSTTIMWWSFGSNISVARDRCIVVAFHKLWIHFYSDYRHYRCFIMRLIILYYFQSLVKTIYKQLKTMVYFILFYDAHAQCIGLSCMTHDSRCVFVYVQCYVIPALLSWRW